MRQWIIDAMAISPHLTVPGYIGEILRLMKKLVYPGKMKLMKVKHPVKALLRLVLI